jgi:PAS domain S-box-containing protein
MQRRIQYWNAGAERTYGWTAEEVLGRSAPELLQTVPVGMSLEDVTASLMAESLWEGEVEQGALDGRRIVATSRQTLRRGSDGAPTSILEINRDITERKVLERERAQRVLEAQRQHERDRIAMDLHDGVIQSIYALGQSLESASDELATDPAGARDEIERNIEQLQAVISDIRSYIFQLRRPELTDDIGAAIRLLAGNVERSSSISVQTEVDDALPAVNDERMVALYHVAQEALANALRHSRASAIRVSLRGADSGITLTIEDDGVGFDASAQRGEQHNGVHNMAARADAVGGRLALRSEPGEGSRITLELPV